MLVTVLYPVFTVDIMKASFLPDSTSGDPLCLNTILDKVDCLKTQEKLTLRVRYKAQIKCERMNHNKDNYEFI